MTVIGPAYASDDLARTQPASAYMLKLQVTR